MLAALLGKAQSTDVRATCAVADSVRYAGPRGELRVRDRHVDQRIYVAQASGLQFDVVAELSAAA